jgi:hypothetical protein
MRKSYSLLLVALLLAHVLAGQVANPQPANVSQQSSAQPAATQDKPTATTPADAARVFITDSASWSVGGSSGGSGGSYGGAMAGGARPQTAEIIKTFGERCPEVKVNNKQEKADYIVLLDHEGGKGLLRHKNKVAVFNRMSGDSIVSKSTLSLGGSVQEACEAITRDWLEHGVSIRAASVPAPEESAPVTIPVAAPAAATTSTAKLQIDSTPPGADVEVDGSFVGNTPSDVRITEGDHTVVVKRSGFKDWERKLKASAGSSVHISAELEKADNP